MKPWLLGVAILILGGMLILRTYDVGRLDKVDIAIAEAHERHRIEQRELIILLIKENKTEEDYRRIEELIQ